MPTTDPGLAPTPGELPRAQQLRQALRSASPAPGCGSYVLLDGARIPKLWVILRELKVEHGCLFRESPNENLTRVAPFMAKADPDGDLMLWMALQDPSLEAALFLFTEATPGALYKHLRRFLLVRDTEGSENYLRFYDPRVLQPFFASSTDAERRQFFGPIRRLLAYDPEASEAADKIVLRQWNPPLPAAKAAEARPPSATDMFRLSTQHETVFDKDCMERYDKRCIKFLRQRYGHRLGKATDADIQAVVDEAKQLSPKLGLPSGRDVAITAELLVLGFPAEMRQKIESVTLKDRPGALQLLRDRMMAQQLEPSSSSQPA
jgi:hypothetical protein